MIVAVGTLQLHFPEVHGLKHKRQILKSLLDRARSRFNASVAEVDKNDLWQTATVGVALVSNDKTYLQTLTQKIENLFQERQDAELINIEWEYL